MAFVLKGKSLGSKPQNWRKKGLFWATFRSILGENMAFFAKSRRKLRTKNFEAQFHRKLRTLEKCSNVKKLRTTEPQPIFTGSYKRKKVYFKKMWRKLRHKDPGHIGLQKVSKSFFAKVNLYEWLKYKQNKFFICSRKNDKKKFSEVYFVHPLWHKRIAQVVE